jgi:hypothetical protein
MKFADLIPGLLKGKDYTFTDKGKDEVHYYITIAAPINHNNECLCVVYFDEIDEDDEIDPEPYEIERLALRTNLWHEVTTDDYYVSEAD